MNEDWVAITLHSYRVRWQLAAKDPLYQKIDDQIADDISIKVPTLVLHGDSGPVAIPEMYMGKEGLFKETYTLKSIKRARHFPQRENPMAVSDAILGFLK
jgi:pimeloyl-ACP methyl ester carboxylesterase